MNENDLIKEIEIAFAGVKLEDGVSWREADVLDSYGTAEERKKAREQDEQDDWTNISFALIGDLRYQSVLPFLDAKGLRFYLPVCMIYALKKYKESNSLIIDSTIYKLTYTDSITEVQNILNEKQKIAVAKFLNRCIEIGDFYFDVNDDIQNQIKKYWFKYLNT